MYLKFSYINHLFCKCCQDFCTNNGSYRYTSSESCNCESLDSYIGNGIIRDNNNGSSSSCNREESSNIKESWTDTQSSNSKRKSKITGNIPIPLLRLLSKWRSKGSKTSKTNFCAPSRLSQSQRIRPRQLRI